jgi:transposase
MPDVAIAMQCIETLPPTAELVADKGYDANALRAWLAERGTTAVIPPKKNRIVQIPYDRRVYNKRNVIERMFCRFKDWRRLATRYDRKVQNFLATVTIAAILNWWL